MKDDRDSPADVAASTKHVGGKRRGTARKQAATKASPKKSAVGRQVTTAERSRPVQLTIFDYAASIGVTLLSEAS